MRKTDPLLLAILMGASPLLVVQSRAAGEEENGSGAPLMMLPRRSNERWAEESKQSAPRDSSEEANHTAQARRDAEMDHQIEETGEDPNKVAPNREQLTLDHFRAALEAHPEAERFIIVTHQNGSCSIEPEAADLLAQGRNRSDNMQVIDTLRILIGTGVADDLL